MLPDGTAGSSQELIHSRRAASGPWFRIANEFAPTFAWL